MEARKCAICPSYLAWSRPKSLVHPFPGYFLASQPIQTVEYLVKSYFIINETPSNSLQLQEHHQTRDPQPISSPIKLPDPPTLVTRTPPLSISNAPNTTNLQIPATLLRRARKLVLPQAISRQLLPNSIVSVRPDRFCRHISTHNQTWVQVPYTTSNDGGRH